MRSTLHLLARRIATLQLQIQSEFPLAEDLRQSPDLSERIDTTPVELAAAAALQALADLADELAPPPPQPQSDTSDRDNSSNEF